MFLGKLYEVLNKILLELQFLNVNLDDPDARKRRAFRAAIEGGDEGSIGIVNEEKQWLVENNLVEDDDEFKVGGTD